MSGNVWQWCEDWYDNEHQSRVLRGGSWVNFGRENLLSSRRYYFTPDFRDIYYGFRCVLASGVSP